MLNLSNTPKAPSAPAFVQEVDTKSFMSNVIEASQKRVILAFFSSINCNNCKQLAPVLEKLVDAEKGAARLAKVNIEKNPQLVQQLQVQSVPTVFAFFQGQVIDGFMGPLPEEQIETWLQKLIRETESKPEENLEEDAATALKQAEKYLLEGDIFMAKAVCDDVLDYAPEEPRAYALKLRCLIAEKDIEGAKQWLAEIPSEMAQDKALEPIHAALELADQTEEKQGQTEALEEKIADDQNNHQARFDLALAYYADGKREKAVDVLLEIMAKDRTWNDDAARKQLIKLFDVFGPEDPLTIDARKRLSTLLFS
ncbi:MAG TPA: co-chaperone YbbN [Rhodospirillaceae bacterium]|nr:co-chaperone YbbN [Rhodospirillaceae bacterium]